MSLFTILADLESNDELHEGRLLILLHAFSGDDGSKTIDGITKLAKLDFLLRYPVYLERALAAKGKNTKNVAVAEHERHSIESKMVRYRFGPWDHRYRRFINLLAARGLVHVTVDGRTIKIGLTEAGLTYSSQLREYDSFSDMTTRASLIHRNFDILGTNLMKFIYATFPEVVELRLGEEID